MKVLLYDSYDSIDKLKFSSSTFDILYKSNIKTIRDLLDMPKYNIKKIEGLELKNIIEIYNMIENLEEVIDNKQEGIDNNLRTFIYTDGLEYIDIKIEDLKLSRRSYNCLKNNKIYYFSEFFRLSDKDLLKIDNLGKVSLKEINDLKKSIDLDNYRILDINKELEFLDLGERKLVIEIAKILEINEKKLFTKIIENNEARLNKIEEFNTQIDELDILDIIFQVEDIRIKSKRLILDIICEEDFGVSLEELYYKIPKELRNEKFLDQILNEFFDEDIADFLYDDRIMYKRTPFQDSEIESLTKREHNILVKRFNGMTLEAIGEIYNISRERVRQLEVEAIRKLSEDSLYYYEDDFKYIYLNYKLVREDYYLALGSNNIYNYLNTRYYSEASKKPEELLIDKKVPIAIRKKFEKAIYKDYIIINSNRVKKTRDDLVNYALKIYAKNNISFDDFKQKYLLMIENLKLSNNKNLNSLSRGYENKLLASGKCLWKQGRIIRYYNQEYYDFSDLFIALDLNQYNDVEYSTLKFFRQFPELMKEYDIRDEYELHNLLKKICDKEKYPNIKFNRMPNIEFGKSDREKQVIDLLYMLAPIHNNEYAEEYESKYGVRASTVLANYASCIEKYLHQGEYMVDFPEIPDEVRIILISRLKEDIYLMDEAIQKINEFSLGIKPEQINPRSLKSLGFIPYEKYIINDKYNSSAHYFNYLLTRNDLLDLNNIDSEIRQILNFSSQLYKLKSELEIIEYAPNKYINLRKLEDLGITKDCLENFTNQVVDMLGEGKYFTISSIRKKGFNHDLDELGFDDWFYTSILIEDKDRISYIRYGKNKIMFTGRHDFSIEEFIESIVYSQEDLYIDIYEMDSILKNEFGVFIDIYKMITIIRASDMYYDEITEQVYGDYEIYYEVI